MKQIIISATLMLLVACAGQAPLPDPGFELVSFDRHSELQVASGVDLGQYRKVILEIASVEFRDNWVKDQYRLYDNVIREKDEQRIKTGMSESLGKVLSRELSDAGYEMSNESGEGVMRFTPRITDLNVVAPDRVKDTISYAMTDSQGSLTLELDIYDSVSNALLATSRQHRDDPYKGYMERTTSATNRMAFRLMMERWSDWLLDGILKTED